VYQTQVKEEETNEEIIMVKKRRSVKSTRETILMIE